MHSINQSFPLRAMVVGLGNIGLNYDYFSSRNILTHANAYFSHPHYNLIGGVDPSSTAQEKFKKKYNKNSYSTIKDIPDIQNVEIFSSCVPYVQQFICVEEILSRFNPKIILCEKPLTSSYELSKKLLQIAKNKNCAICVNYMRRFEPGVNAIRALLLSGKIGKIQKIHCWYTKSFLINASHLIDLCHYFWGAPQKIVVKKKYLSFATDQILIDFEMLMCNEVEIIVSALPINQSLFELDIIGETGRVKYENGGQKISVLLSNQDKIFENVKGFFKKKSIKNEFFKYQYHVLESISEYLTASTILKSTGETALMTEKTMSEIIGS